MKTKYLILCCAIGLFGLGITTTTARSRAGQSRVATEAPVGFDSLSNGFVDQATFDADRTAFASVETAEDGIGPVYNAASCAECHANPVIGGASQVLEMRAGHFDGTSFIEHPGGSLIHSRAIHPAIQERLMDGNEVRAFRASTSVLGLGFVEAIEDETLLAIAEAQRLQTGGRVSGQAILVTIHEAPESSRVGRFGWKCQHASLISFAGDAYLNEMGITTPLFPIENTSNGESVAEYDHISDPDEADNDDVEAFARFMRATKAPTRDVRRAATPEAQAGEALFNSMGCAVCHVPDIQTAPVGTVLNGGAFLVTEALGDKIIHPYGDFLLHDIGSGDGIADSAFPSTRNKIRTSPLWGLRTRNRFMHDGASLTMAEAILRHSGEAQQAAAKYRKLKKAKKRHVQAFLESL